MRVLHFGTLAVLAAGVASISVPASAAGASVDSALSERAAQPVAESDITYCNRQPGEIIEDPVGCALEVYNDEMYVRQRCVPAIPTVDETAYCSSVGAELGKPVPVPAIGDPLGIVDGAAQTVTEDSSCGTRARSGICAGKYRVNEKSSAYCHNHYTGPSDFCSDKNGDGDHKFGPWHHLTSSYSGGGSFELRVYVLHENGANQHLASGNRRADTGWFGGQQWLNGRVWQGDNNRHTIHGFAER